MNIKAILKDPEAAINQLWGEQSHCNDRAAILETADKINQITSVIKTLKNDKNHCASQFKPNKENPEEISRLKDQMKEISSQLNIQEEKRKHQNDVLLGYFSIAKNKLPAVPKQFSTIAQQRPATGEISIQLIDDSKQSEWDNYVNQHTNSGLYHRYEWRKLIHESFSHQSHYFAAISNGIIIGILPTIRLKSALFGDFSISMPFFNYGGVLADTPEIANALLEYAARYCNSNNISHLEIRATQQLNNWPTKSEKVSMIKQLPDSIDQLDKELGSKVRAQINRAKAKNTRTVIGKLDLLNDFYTVFSINMRDLGTPVYGKSFFRNILTQWNDIANIVIIYLENKPVSAAFLLANKDMVEIPWASTLRKTNSLNMNMLLYWEVLSFVITERYHFFDFGRSSLDSSTYRFKKQWGATPIQHYWHYWLKDGQALPEINPNNKKFELLIAIWKKLPVSVTRLIGPLIVKNIP
ncbi:FemAB family XrtA/PEP-CTERM system-associated protein [Oceanicoccus sp. KOV_DT_Chl]|uniref:FemAB family XrtA/PEP-CTERM system-associated protein n=1 Tax=Oceanicoccus sp. KOV_DT_Chl TaxID=1904639 RepID=UPI00190E5F0C|nr:FemAB family XrtA/PEP-CTERM system-associated protein [Oceanicoccus sp. KOV_DT_Chl]